jgi:hypothetical protein
MIVLRSVAPEASVPRDVITMLSPSFESSGFDGTAAELQH